MGVIISLVLCSIIFGLIGIIGVFLAMMSPMILDSPGSENNKIKITTVISILTFPFACFLSIIISWILFNFGFEYRACLIFIAPLINLLIFGSMLILLGLLGKK
jgi:hypothetical protein